MGTLLRVVLELGTVALALVVVRDFGWRATVLVVVATGIAISLIMDQLSGWLAVIALILTGLLGRLLTIPLHKAAVAREEPQYPLT